MTKSEVSFLFVDDAQITIMNRQYFKRDNPTDVIAFPQDYGSTQAGPHLLNLGDIVISLERAEEQAKRYRKTLIDEIKLLIVHGVLHLMGYDDIKKEDKKKMRAMERKLLRRLKEI